MIIKSIRWRLQIWYGAILLAVLGGFGVTAFQLERARQFRRIDDELQVCVGSIAGAFRPGPRGPGGQAGEMNDEGPGFPPPDDGSPESSNPKPHPRRVPPAVTRLLQSAEKGRIYYVVWWRDGSLAVKSANSPANLTAPAQVAGRPAHAARTREDYRELYVTTPPGEIMLAGRNIQADLAELRLGAWKMAGVGGVVLLLGLAGGWLLASRAIRPVADIGATAAQIAAGDLSRRVDVAETESELGQLAGVLNSAFARLEAAFAQQQQFTSDAAHELRTPLAVILAQTQTILKRERTAPEYRDSLEACQRAAQRMRRLIECLLELARLDAGQEPMNRMALNLADVAQDCADFIRPLAEAQGLALHYELPKLECRGDSDRLSQVVMNLLTNAMQYNRPGGEIRVSGRKLEGLVELAITNTGPGIAPGDLPRVFERFYRADKARASANSGLGLAIGKAIIEAHGGTVTATSEVGQLTTFTIRLPA